MTKFEEKKTNRPFFRVRMKDAPPPPNGFAVRYVSGMEGTAGVEPGFWLTQCDVDRDGFLNFRFEPELFFTYEKESDAKNAADALEGSGEIKTEIVKFG